MADGRILVDLTDLLFFTAQSPSPTGIQRVQLDVFPHLAASFDNIDAVYFDSIRGCYRLLALDRIINGDRDYCRSVAMASRKLHWRALHSVTSTAPDLGAVVPVKARDIVYVAGSGWIPRRRHKTLQQLAKSGVKLVWMCFDLVPVSFKSAKSKQRSSGSRFQNWLDAAIRDKGKFICISDHVRDNLAAYAHDMGETINAVSVPLAHEFRFAEAAVTDKVEALTKRDYALYVSSLGLRKNHLALLQAWQRLSQIHGAELPTLVLAGSRWKETNIFPFLEQTQWLGGKIVHISGLSDADIAALYRNCRFTVYPSLSEGWGLPVGESLWMGKPCVCADNTSLPEVGGKWVSYFKADEPASMDKALDRAIHSDFDGLPPDRSQLRTWDRVAAEIAREVVTP
jgi:glycosyltransferase involved in cell wall biosynthesis